MNAALVSKIINQRSNIARSWEAPVTTRNSLQPCMLIFPPKTDLKKSLPNWNQVQSWDRGYGDHKQLRRNIFAQPEVLPTISFFKRSKLH